NNQALRAHGMTFLEIEPATLTGVFPRRAPDVSGTRRWANRPKAERKGLVERSRTSPSMFLGGSQGQVDDRQEGEDECLNRSDEKVEELHAERHDRRGYRKVERADRHV